MFRWHSAVFKQKSCARDENSGLAATGAGSGQDVPGNSAHGGRLFTVEAERRFVFASPVSDEVGLQSIVGFLAEEQVIWMRSKSGVGGEKVVLEAS